MQEFQASRRCQTVWWHCRVNIPHYRSLRRQFYRSDDPTNSIIALKDDSLPGQGPIPQTDIMTRHYDDHNLMETAPITLVVAVLVALCATMTFVQLWSVSCWCWSMQSTSQLAVHWWRYCDIWTASQTTGPRPRHQHVNIEVLDTHRQTDRQTLRDRRSHKHTTDINLTAAVSQTPLEGTLY